MAVAERVAAYLGRGSEAPAAGRCGAELPHAPDFPAGTPHRYCLHTPRKGLTRCYRHGANTPVGPANPAFRTGKHSVLFKQGSPLWDGYHSSLDDGDLMSLREQIRLTEARERELLRLVVGLDPAAAWSAVREAAAGVSAAVAAGNVTQFAAAVQALERVVAAGRSTDELWQQLFDVGERKRRLVETEARLLERGQHTVTVDQAMMWAGMITDLAMRAFRLGGTTAAAEAWFGRELRILQASGGRASEPAVPA